MFIVLLSGYAGSGKDSAALIFQTYGFKIASVAENVKRQSAKYHGFLYELTHSQQGKSTMVKSQRTGDIKTVREFLIEDSAQNKLINNDPAFWIRLLVQQIKNEVPKFLVISDWRYKEEYDHLKFAFPEAEIIKVRIVRDSVIVNNDKSEHELDSERFNFMICNNGTLEELHKECSKILNRM